MVDPMQAELMKRLDRDRCKSCDAPIVWAMTAKDRRMPLDPVPPEGVRPNVSLMRKTTTSYVSVPTVVVVPAGGGITTSHFATCPDAGRHRRSR